MSTERSNSRLRICSISATAGFLEDCKVTFSPQLTCIIGARGTCKSTLIESLRFALNADARKIAALTAKNAPGGSLEGRTGMLSATLGAGTVRCSVELLDAEAIKTFDIEREIGGAPRLYEEGVREFDSPPHDFYVEVLSQGDLQELASEEGNDRRLALIDRAYQTRVEASEDARRSVGEQLAASGRKRRELYQAIAVLRSEVQNLSAVSQQLAALEVDAPNPSPQLASALAEFEARSAALTRVQSVSKRLSEVQQDLQRLPLIALLTDLKELNDSLARIGAPVAEVWGHAQAEIGNLTVNIDRVSELSPQSTLDELRARMEALNEPYYRLRAEDNAVNERLKQTAVLRRQLDVLEKRSAELAEREAQLSDATLQRSALRHRLNAVDSDLYELRSGEIEKINSEHFETILLSLNVEQAGSAYVALINELLQGSRIRDQKLVAEELAKSLSPSDLIEFVEGVKSQELSDLLNRDLGQAARVLAHLNDHARLYEIEAVAPSTKLDITFYDGATAKPVESLSRGQKATALLPIVMRSLPYPLIIDQPEDDLDNKFIFTFLVRAIQELRDKRQIIFVTHNANIPVLGDANEVVVMQMKSPTKAAEPMQGNVEDRKQEILDLLEGGAQAFLLREDKYGSLLE